MPRPHLGTFAIGLVFGTVTAVALAFAGGMIYTEGSIGSIVALVGAAGALAMIYDESPTTLTERFISWGVLNPEAKGDVEESSEAAGA